MRKLLNKEKSEHARTSESLHNLEITKKELDERIQ